MNEYEISLWEDIFVEGIDSNVYQVQTSRTPVKVVNLDAHPEYYADPHSARNNSAIWEKIPAEGAIEGVTLYVFAKEIDKIKQEISSQVFSGKSDNLEFILSTTDNAIRYVTCFQKEWTYDQQNNQIIFSHPEGTEPVREYFRLNYNANSLGPYKRFASYSEEQKLGVIGSNTMTTICRAEEPKLIEKLNGTHTFSFKMRYVYNDEGQKYPNPWLNLLVNERKVKVKWNNQWYDFIIKNCDESSDGKSIIYTCEDQFITELSKNGFNLEFAQELGNNQGTAVELAKRVLEDTNWQVAGDTIFPEEVEEPVYIVDTSTIRHTVVDVDEHPEYFYDPYSAVGTSDTVKIPLTEESVKIIVFYSQVQDLIARAVNGETSGTGLYLQFGYSPDGYKTDNESSSVITNIHRYLTCWSKKWSYDTSTNILRIFNNQNEEFFHFNVKDGVSQYRAKRLVGSEKTAFDPLTKKYVSVFQAQTNSHIAINGNIKPSEFTDKVPADGNVYHYFYSYEISDTLEDSELVSFNIPVGSAGTLTLNEIYDASTKPEGSPTDSFALTWYYQNPEVSNSLYKTNDIIYMYTETEYQTPELVTNLLTNSNNFSDTTGWSNVTDDGISWAGVLPTVSNWLEDSEHDLTDYPGQSYLELKRSTDVRNNGILPSSSMFENGFGLNDRFVLRVKLYKKNGDAAPIAFENWPSGTAASDKFRCRIRGADGTLYFNTYTNYPRVIHNLSATDNWDWWIEYDLKCYAAASQKELQRNFIYADFRYAGTEQSILIQDIQLFRKITYVDGTDVKIVYPGMLEANSLIRTKYLYYNHTHNEEVPILNSKDITYIYNDYNPYGGSDLVRLYNEGNNKIRSIAAKESNRFNILQSIAETFECWIRFEVDHDSTGKIIGNRRVILKRNIGEDRGLGFIYGIDLKSITRKIQSDQIVTKTIVKPNSNEFAKHGFCTIARSEENYARTEFILNFDYYVSQGMLDGSKLNRDLYLSNGMGYFYTLRLLNIEYDELTEILPNLLDEQTELEAYNTTYSHLLISANEKLTAVKSEIVFLAGATSYNTTAVRKFVKDRADDPDVKSRIATINELNSNIKEYTSVINQTAARLEKINRQITNTITRQDEITAEKKALDKTFYEKYARFLSEGSWTNEEYVDDNLYYLDACSVAYTSSRPKVSYTINVIRVSSLEDFKNKVFHIGDIGFVQDTEFFGYVEINGIKTPYKEKILISEMSFNFEEPDKDTITVQNYKTQFDDLFQRITATTQSLQYASGEYALAAAQVQPGGGLTQESIQSTLDLNTNLVYSALNQTITQDSTGITVADQTNRNNMTKITSGGVFITTDGGVTWKNAIRGDGVATQWLTSGSVNTSKITILDGTQPAFRWDAQGINAFASDEEGVHLETFVRFDKYGVYGIKNYINNEEPGNFIPIDESDIWDEAAFGMTWDGFFMKNKRGSHRVEISSTDDIQVVATPSGQIEVAVIKIGFLEKGSGDEPDLYGIRISNTEGIPVMETGTDGDLWLRNLLSIGVGDTALVQIGYNPDSSLVHEGAHQVFNANNQFIIYEDGSFIATNGTIGQFDVSNNGLVYRDGDKLLAFNVTDGLKIVNAPFSVGTTSEDLLFFDVEQGVLTVTGSITANYLEAIAGVIGGFSISNTALTSPSGKLTLYGNTGHIDAEDISIGTSASINDYIQLGDNAYLYNPDIEADGGLKRQSVIKITNNNDDAIIHLKADGTMSFGTDSGVYIDGNRPAIVWGDTVEITPTLSKFTNVNISGKLMTTIFEVNKTQIVGGSMVFKPSYKVVEVENNNDFTVKLEDSLDSLFIKPNANLTPLNYYTKDVNGIYIKTDSSSGDVYMFSYDGHYVMFVNAAGVLQDNIYKINYVSNNDTLHFTKIANNDLGEIYGCIILGDLDTIGTAAAIGINSGDNNNQFLEARGITISELTKQYSQFTQETFTEDTIYYTLVDDEYIITSDVVPQSGKTYYTLNLASKTKTFLGDLNGLNNSFQMFGGELTGYGLVGDNVFLQGSLTTVVPPNSEDYTYAGVNTTTGVAATIFDNDTSPIVFWAGAASLNNSDIQAARFQVTEQGSLYASQGVFEGSILSRSKIVGAQIYTAEIHGWALESGSTKGNSAALNFFNVTEGLVFNKCTYDTAGSASDTTLLFSIGESGFRTNDNYFVSIDSDSVSFLGQSYTTKNNLTLEGTHLSYNSRAIQFGEAINVAVESKTQLQIKENQIGFGENTLRYVEAIESSNIIGYDLYVTSGSGGQDTASTLDFDNNHSDIIIIDHGGSIGIVEPPSSDETE